jgi:hypothetical protein
MVTDHKNGTPSSGVIVRNNIATDFSFTGGVAEDYNIEITMSQAANYFVNPSGGTGNYHLISTCPAVDSGSNLLAPNIDKDGVSRPQGSGFDIGAYEYNTFTSVEEIISPADFILFQNYPNPFNPTTNIGFRIADGGFISLKVYDILGNEVATLVDEYKPAGEYEVTYYANNNPCGVYIYQLIAGNYLHTRKMVVLK